MLVHVYSRASCAADPHDGGARGAAVKLAASSTEPWATMNSHLIATRLQTRS